MEYKNMKRVSLEEVQALPNGTKVFVECVGSGWCIDDKDLKAWHIKQEDGLHYETEDEEHTISFPYSYDYDDTNMNIIMHVKEYNCYPLQQNTKDTELEEDLQTVLYKIKQLKQENKNVKDLADTLKKDREKIALEISQSYDYYSFLSGFDYVLEKLEAILNL